MGNAQTGSTGLTEGERSQTAERSRQHRQALTDLRKSFGRAALFLDFDGTIAALAPRPDAVRVEPAVKELLATLRARLDGALAIATARPLGEIDIFLKPELQAGAGSYGLELRWREGGDVVSARSGLTAPREALARLKPRLETFALAHPGVLLEEKPFGLALHYRERPEFGDKCRAEMHASVAGEADLDLVEAKMAVEARPKGARKGTAVTQFMEVPPFRGRVPVFCGDDTSDEDGFAVAQGLGGYGVKIGEGPTEALIQFADRSEFIDWLELMTSDGERKSEEEGATR